MKRENLQIAGLLLGFCVFGPGLASAQTTIDMRTQSKNIDFSGALSTRPVKTGAAMPPVCSQGDLFFKTTAPAGQNLYGCAAANTWVALSGAGGGGVAMPVRIWLPAAGCSGSTASTGWDLPSSDAMTAVCLTGANTNKGVGQFPDGATPASAQNTVSIPAEWTGDVSARFRWLTTATAGAVVWQIATACAAPGESDDPAWNAASTVMGTAPASASALTDTVITAVGVTGCAPGELMHLRILRDPSAASDTLAATALLVGVEVSFSR
jgi:hypothetical protein